MIKYIAKRLLLIIPVLLGAIIVVFTINSMSEADPAMIKLGLSATNEELLAAKRAEMGLDRPYLVQLGDYLWGLLQGDLGDSYVYSKTVWELLAPRIPNTLKLSVSSMLISIILGIPLGMYAALHQNSIADYGTTTIAVVFQAIPGFLLALFMMVVFAVKLRWFPVSGADTWKHYVLPVLASCMGGVASNARMTRSAVLEVIRQDYVRTARSKGIEERDVLTKHILKNALIPIITMIGTSLGNLLSGSVLVELIFNIPGMGSLISSSIMSKDFITVQGCVVVCAIVVALANLLTDLAYAFVDPRIKAQYTAGSKKKEKMQQGGASA